MSLVIAARPLRVVMAIFLLVLGALALPDTTDAAEYDQIKKLVSSDAEAIASFGESVAISGDTAVIGASNGGGGRAGVAYAFQRDVGGPENWGEVKKLVASDTQATDRFGRSVAISNDTIIVGAYLEDSAAPNAGAAYVFQRNEGGADNWGEVAKITASDPETNGDFGLTVSVSGDTAVVGAGRAVTAGIATGAVYVFERNEGGADNWGEVLKLTASDAEAWDYFGLAAAVSADTIVAGAPQEDTGGNGAGAAYVFRRDEGGIDTWGEMMKLTAPDGGASNFGNSVAVSGDTAVVGALFADAGGSAAGAAYVFQRDLGGADNWGDVKKLTASDAEAGDLFGGSVAVSGDTAVVGARDEDTKRFNAGAAYVFQRNEGGADNWGELKKLTAAVSSYVRYFGTSVTASGDTAVVGAPIADPGGAAYVFAPTTPGPVGGISLDPELRPLATDTPEAGGAPWAAVAAAVAAAGLLAAGGAAWYARRRAWRF